MRLTRTMRETLELARKQELRRVHDGNGSPPGPHINTLNALVRHELLAASERRTRRGHRLQAWTITDAGRQALEPREVFRRQPDVYLCNPIPETAGTNTARGDFTTLRSAGVDELPITDPATLSDAWEQLADERRRAAQDRRARARRLARTIRRAA